MRTDPVADEVRALRDAVQAMRADLLAVRLAVDGAATRRALLGDLLTAVSLGATWHGAQHVARILAGDVEPPASCRAAVAALRADPRCPRSPRQLLRIAQERIATAAAVDIGARLCQWPPIPDDATVPTDEGE